MKMTTESVLDQLESISGQILQRPLQLEYLSHFCVRKRCSSKMMDGRKPSCGTMFQRRELEKAIALREEKQKIGRAYPSNVFAQPRQGHMLRSGVVEAKCPERSSSAKDF